MVIWSLGMPDSSFTYLRLATALNDKLDKAEKEKIQEFQAAGFEGSIEGTGTGEGENQTAE